MFFGGDFTQQNWNLFHVSPWFSLVAGCQSWVFGAQMRQLIFSSKDLFQELCQAAILFLADVVVKQLLSVHYVTVMYNAC